MVGSGRAPAWIARVRMPQSRSSGSLMAWKLQSGAMSILPGPLVDTDWLAAHLGDVRVIEPTAYLDPPIVDGKPYHPRAGRAEYDGGHIPGAAFADVVHGLAEPHESLNSTFPSPERFAAGMSALGVEDGVDVVIYDRNGMMWATRLWWMLRAYGFDAAAVLDGGFDAWPGRGPARDGRAGGLTAPPPSPCARAPRSWPTQAEVADRPHLPAHVAFAGGLPRRAEPLRARRPDPGQG